MIKGFQLRDAIISGSNNIGNHKEYVNSLNIFPVPDGDTGTNMTMTIMAAAKALSKLDDSCTVSDVAKTAASAMLRGARGNSGVILSLLFKGLSQGLKDQIEVDGVELTNALAQGVNEAYGAVMKPTEGTILTVARVSTEVASSAFEIDSDPVYVWGAVCSGAALALEETPELLPVLKKAGVVDAGGKGLCLIFDGMLSVFKHELIVQKEDGLNKEENDFESVIAQFDEEINFTYCTECIVIKNTDIEKDPKELRDYLETMGDSVVLVDDDEIIKLHVHTEEPLTVLTRANEYGDILNIKVENMRAQNEEAKSETKAPVLMPQEPTEDIGFVGVAAGKGLIELFTELGCSHVVSGGQTMNPSTEDMVKAILATPAKTVFVLPNNKNIIMAAQQAIPLVTDREVLVIPTKTIPQGISAMISFDPDSSIEENSETMMSVIDVVDTGLVTFAARDSEFGNSKIKEGEILGLCNGKMDFVEKSPVNACYKVVKSLVTKKTSFVTLIYGNDIGEEDAQKAYDLIKNKLSSNIEVTLIKGDQPVYYFIVSVE